MLYDETGVRDNLRNREGKRVFYLGKKDTLTPSARDFLSRERVEILPAEEARPARYRLLNGGYVEEKPEHMTHLHGDILVSKTHPRIRFRGALDTLQAQLLLCGEPVREVLDLSRKILSYEVLDKPLEEVTLYGLTEQEQRRHSHFPQEYYGIPHFMPEIGDDPMILQLNLCRCLAREAELAAAVAFEDPQGNCMREDLMRGLNRISSMLYILMLRQKAAGIDKGKGM